MVSIIGYSLLIWLIIGFLWFGVVFATESYDEDLIEDIIYLNKFYILICGPTWWIIWSIVSLLKWFTSTRLFDIIKPER